MADSSVIYVMRLPAAKTVVPQTRGAPGPGGDEASIHAWKPFSRDAGDPGLVHVMIAEWTARKTRKCHSREVRGREVGQSHSTEESAKARARCGYSAPRDPCGGGP